MKKFTLTVLSLLCSTVGLLAAVPANGVYEVKHSDRGYLTQNVTANTLHPGDATLGGFTTNEKCVVGRNSNGYQSYWYLYTSETSGNSYIFSASNGMFLAYENGTNSGTLFNLSSTPAPFDIVDATTSGNYQIHAHGVSAVALSNSIGWGKDVAYRFASVSSDYDGIPHAFVTASGEFDQSVIDTAIAAINSVEATQQVVTYTFPEFGGHTLTMEATVLTGTDASTAVPSVTFFTATGVEEVDKVVSTENHTFTVTGSWTFPFALETAYRADMRQSASNSCTNFYYNSSNGKVETRNGTDAAAFVAERLFYVSSTGFSADGQLKVTLHSIAADEAQGFQVSADNNALGAFSATPTEFLVVTNSNGTAGVSLRHPGNSNSHVNDVNGTLGVWQDGGSQNDGGSYLRFKALEDSDFDNFMSSSLGSTITQEMLEAAKSTKGAAEVRAIFEGATTDVTFTFPAFGDQTLTMTLTNQQYSTNASEVIPSVPFFTATGLEGDDTIVSAENTAFTVIGTWAFPFEDEEVYRIDIRKKGATDAGTCSNLIYNATTNQVDTRNGTDADAFVPERLFYLDAQGFDATGNLKVTLHTIAVDANKGFQVGTTTKALGTFTETPVEFLVVTNSSGTDGVSLRHPDAANCHVNDIDAHLGVWTDARSQNDVGSFLRFGALTDADFDGLMSGDLADAAKASKKATEVRALFDAVAPYLAAVAEAETLLASIGIYTPDHFGEDLGYFYGTDYDAIAALAAALQGTLEGTDVDAITAATAALAEEVAKVQVHLPEAGKFYRFKGVEGGYYITPSAATGQMVMTEEPSANSVFRFNEVEGENNVFVPFNVVYQTGITGTYSLGGSETYTFYPSQSGVAGAFTIKSNTNAGGQWVYNNYDKGETEKVVDRHGSFHERCNWYLEEVNEDGTGIEEINVESDKVQGIYDLQGRRLSAPVKGINIINGKKVLVK